MAVLEPDDIPQRAARAAFRMYLRFEGSGPVGVRHFQQILATCLPLVAEHASRESDAFGGVPDDGNHGG